jgi:hypothetical protein
MKRLTLVFDSPLAEQLRTSLAHGRVQWEPASTPEYQYETALGREVLFGRPTAEAPLVPGFSNDQPVEDCTLLRLEFRSYGWKRAAE